MPIHGVSAAALMVAQSARPSAAAPQGADTTGASVSQNSGDFTGAGLLTYGRRGLVLPCARGQSFDLAA